MKSTYLLSLGAVFALTGIAQARGDDRPDRPKGGTRPLPPEMIEKYDEDDDGKLSSEERKVMREERRAKMEEVRKKALQKFDQDGDGELSDSERQVLRDAIRKRRLERFDEDSDGRLREEERTEMKRVLKIAGVPMWGGRDGRGPRGQGREQPGAGRRAQSEAAAE